MGRRALVIGSQCDAMPTLDFLPKVADELHDVLTDERLGACQPALPGGPRLDPSKAELLDAVEEAFAVADHEGSTLLLAFIGHGLAIDDDFYFLPRDGVGTGRSTHDVHLSQVLKELLRDSAELDGLVVLLDTCYAGTGAEQAAGWREVGLGRHLRRYEILTATANQSAYDGAFARALVRILSAGIPTAGTTIDARYLQAPLMAACGNQRPQRITHDGGGWTQAGDEGLWLARNAALQLDNDSAATRAVSDRIVELTSHLQPTLALDQVVSAAREHRCVVVTGPRGSGKSTLAAALARPAVTRERVPADFVHGVAFATRTSTLADLAGALASQLTDSLPGFAAAGRAYRSRLSPAEVEGLDAFQRLVVGPLAYAAPGAPVRLVIDALDELPRPTQDAIRAAVTGATDLGLYTVLTARPAAPRPAGSHRLNIGQAEPDIIRRYFQERGIAEEYINELVIRTGGSWLHAYLLADRALAPGFALDRLPDGVQVSLANLYDGELLAAGAGNRDDWESLLRPVLGVLAVAGTGPVLPISLAVAASAQLGGPSTRTAFRDVLARLSGLIGRDQAGQTTERVGLFHASLAEDYLLRTDGTVQFSIDAPECHSAVADAIDKLAPTGRHNAADPMHQYALYAEPDHRWEGRRDAASVMESLRSRPVGRATDQRERQQRWSDVLSAAYGPEHPHTLTVRADLARWTGVAGDATAAREQFAELLPILERVSGPSHPETVTVRAELARWTGVSGDPAAARTKFAELLPILEEVCGVDHPETLTARANLARWTGAAGDPAAARDQFAGLLPNHERVYGHNHPETLTVRANAARWTGLAGDPAAARDQFAQLLPVRERVSGPEHRHTLADRAELARWTGTVGDAGAARDQFAELLPTHEHVSGPEHPHTLTVRADLARWTGVAGDATAAREQFAELLPIRERVSGPSHPETVTVRAELARWTEEAAHPDLA